MIFYLHPPLTAHCLVCFNIMKYDILNLIEVINIVFLLTYVYQQVNHTNDAQTKGSLFSTKLTTTNNPLLFSFWIF